MIYLDNAATTHFKPQCVIDTVTQCLTKYSFNPNRNSCKQSLHIQQKIQDTRVALNALVCGDDASHVAFTPNCTVALNLAILGTARRGGHIVTTVTEHNSVLRPVMQLCNKGLADVTYIAPNSNGDITPDILNSALRADTYLVILNHCSNVTGKCQDITTLGKALKRAKPDVMLLIDGAQSIGYTNCDISTAVADMIALPAHKGLHGIQGCGALVFTAGAIPNPIILGGTGTDSHSVTQPTTLPEGLESGTLNTPAILALYSALDWWAYNHTAHHNVVTMLQSTLIDGLRKIPNVKLYSSYNDSGIVAMSLDQYDSTVIADTLSNRYDIVSRGGLHCAPLMHRYLGTTDTGLVRLSVACDNTLEQCYKVLNCIDILARSM